jgi:hypothetical protein
MACENVTNDILTNMYEANLDGASLRRTNIFYLDVLWKSKKCPIHKYKKVKIQFQFSPHST